ncbi:MAG: hypothetical protein WAV51_01130 [Microgenomates group bacterium]
MHRKKIFRVVFWTCFVLLLDCCIGHFYLQKTHRQYYTDLMQKERGNSNRVSDSMYHHGLVPNTEVLYSWNNSDPYPLYVNSLGLLDKEIRFIPKTTEKHRILFLGDSFTEGLGYPYKKTFVGRIAQALGDENYDVLNGGLMTYSPKLYLEKTKYIVASQEIQVDEVVILLDLSDIHNEAYKYRNFQPVENSNIAGATQTIIRHALWDKLKGASIDNSLLVNSLYTITVRKKEKERMLASLYPYQTDYQAWTYNNKQFAAYGNIGLSLCKTYLAELVAFLRNHAITNITLVVYPWPQQITYDTVDCIQATYWQTFATEQNISFVNLFPQFFSFQQKENLYNSDNHFNERGHQVVADVLMKTIGATTEATIK